MQSILITGGCGLLGSYLVKAIRRSGIPCQIKLLDKVGEPRLKLDGDEVEILAGRDICNLDSIKNDFKHIDTVIHCAGLVSFHLKDKEALYQINVAGTENVLAASQAAGVDHFIHVSSTAALGYNDRLDHPISEDFVFDWSRAKKRNKHYMMTKHLSDRAVRGYNNIMQVLIIHPGLMLGPCDRKITASWITAIKNKSIKFNLPGGTNLVDVRDVADGITRAMNGSIVGSLLLGGHNLRFKTINKVIAEMVHVEPPRITLPKCLGSIFYYTALGLEKLEVKVPVSADSIDSGFKFRYFDSSKALKMLHWQPTLPLDNTMNDTYSWMLKNDLIEK